MRVKIAPQNLEILEKISKEYNIPATQLVNSCVFEKLGDKLKLLKEFEFENIEEKKDEEIEVRLKLFKKEKAYIKAFSNQIGINSITGTVKFIVLNSILESKYLNIEEIRAFGDLKYEINILGKNIHHILKQLNFKKEFEKDDFLQNYEDFKEKINQTIAMIEKRIEITKERF